MAKKPVVALVLGGGGARGMAHIGVLKILEEAQIPIDLIVGTSAGSLVGAMYATSQNVVTLIRRFEEFLQSKTYNHTGMPKFLQKKPAENFFGQVATYLEERIVINLAYSRTGLLERRRLREAVDFLVDPVSIRETKIPYAAVAVDLISAKELIFTEGNLQTAVEASSSLPGFLPPLKQNSHVLVDGAVLHTVPVIPAKKLGADFIIAVNVSQSLDNEPELDNVIDILFRSNSITSYRYSRMQMKEADLIIRPDVGDVHWSNFSRFNELIEKGEEVARKAVPVIRQKMQKKFQFGYRWFRGKRETIWIDNKGVRVYQVED
ncbi:MAG: patatin-like phospholipase family protein [Calditrichaeota bacterium]|nr:patatin-like phospholipase family protein [Calditrichota bacterium]